MEKIIPEITVIVPCYKQAEYLDECLESVVSQTFDNWECLIIDDGSPDNTEYIANVWCQKDTRIKYYKKINEGVSIARNYGIALSKGKYILPLDADDKIGKQYMELALPYLHGNENIKIVYCNAEYFGTIQGPVELHIYSFKEMLINNMIFNCAFFRKIDWEKNGGYDVNMTEGLEDWEFWINMLSNGGEVQKINSVQFYYRQKGESRNTNSIFYTKKLTDYICAKHFKVYNMIYGNHIENYHKSLEFRKINYELNMIKKSKDYRLGKILLTPLRAIKHWLITLIQHRN